MYPSKPVLAATVALAVHAAWSCAVAAPSAPPATALSLSSGSNTVEQFLMEASVGDALGPHTSMQRPLAFAGVLAAADGPARFRLTARKIDSLPATQQPSKPPNAAAVEDSPLRSGWLASFIAVSLIGYQLRRQHRFLRPQRFTV